MVNFFSRLFKKSAPPEPSAAPQDNTPADSEAADRLIAEGNALEDAGQIHAALEKYQQALALSPNYWSALLNLGIAHDALSNRAEALDYFARAHEANPDGFATCYNFARVLSQTTRKQEAQTLMEHALELRPDFFDALVILADIHAEQQQFEQAQQTIDRALAINPSHTGALRNKATYLELSGAVDDALALLEKAPKSPDVCAAQAQLMVKHGWADEALPMLKEAFISAPEKNTLDSYLMASCYAACMPAGNVLPEHLHTDELLRGSQPPTHPPDARAPDAGGKLRIGFLSADFKAHAIAYFIEPLLMHLNRKRFSIHLYSSADEEDAITQRLRSRVENWRDIQMLSAQSVAERLREDGIDVLIDLSGHTAGNRLDVLALKPAPVIASWIGYLATTGLKTVDWRIVDAVSDPPGMTESQHCEKLLRLPGCQWSYLPQDETPPLAEAPAVKNGYITFGSFNQCAKLSAPCLNLWARLMASLPDSRMVFAAIAPGRPRQRILDIFAAHGIDADRLAFQERVPWSEYLQSYSRVDIALDSWPYTGATTSCDALLMGVPVLTLTGSRSVSRSGASLLTALGRPEWIADTEEQFIAAARALAANASALAELRPQLRAEFLASPICDGATFTRHFEAALLQMSNSDA